MLITIADGAVSAVRRDGFFIVVFVDVSVTDELAEFLGVLADFRIFIAPLDAAVFVHLPEVLHSAVNDGAWRVQGWPQIWIMVTTTPTCDKCKELRHDLEALRKSGARR